MIFKDNFIKGTVYQTLTVEEVLEDPETDLVYLEVMAFNQHNMVDNKHTNNTPPGDSKLIPTGYVKVTIKLI